MQHLFAIANVIVKCQVSIVDASFLSYMVDTLLRNIKHFLKRINIIVLLNRNILHNRKFLKMSLLIRTDVTAVKFFNKYVLAGMREVMFTCIFDLKNLILS